MRLETAHHALYTARMTKTNAAARSRISVVAVLQRRRSEKVLYERWEVDRLRTVREIDLDGCFTRPGSGVSDYGRLRIVNPFVDVHATCASQSS